MEKEIKTLLNESILKEAANKFGTTAEELTLIGGFQNFIYEFIKDGKPNILRITHSSHRSENLVRAELNWVLYLSENDISVSRPVCSLSGNLTERVDLEDCYFIISVFEKAKGKKLNYPEYLGNEKLFVKFGEITGKIHRLSKSYSQESSTVHRHDWMDNYYIKNIEKFIPMNQYGIHKSCKELLDIISGLRKNREVFGLIHGDINVGNFFLDRDKITIFDFDECQYSWFIEDIAIQLYYAVYVILDDTIDEREEMAKKFMNKFMEGYKIENSIDDDWLNILPLFLKLREIIVHIGIYRSWDFNDLNQWQRDYIEQSRDRIEKGIPLVNML